MASPGIRERLHRLYFGDDARARRFRYTLIGFDIVTIAVFLVSPLGGQQPWMIALDVAIGVLLSVEFGARLAAQRAPLRHLLSFTTAADLVVIASLLLPIFLENFAFLRIARALRLLRSYHLLRDLRADSDWFRLHEDIVQRTVNLGVFIFIVTSVVYVTQHNINPKIATYVDALYFTITTLTTTGFGDITMEGAAGRLLAGGHHGGRRRALPEAAPGHLPASQGAVPVSRLRAPAARHRCSPLQALRTGAADPERGALSRVALRLSRRFNMSSGRVECRPHRRTG